MSKRLEVNKHKEAFSLLDPLPIGSVVLDRYGHAWQSGRCYWYRSYGDSTQFSTWDLAFRHPFTVLHKNKETP